MKNGNEKIIIFDMDGVLIDSEPAYIEMNKELFRELKIEMTEEYHRFVGLSSVKMWTYLKNKFSLSPSVSELIEAEKIRMYDILNSEIISKPIDGVEVLIEMLLDRNYNLSVASSSAKKNIELVLNKLNLRKNFEYIVSGEEVNNGKPAPDIFLKVKENFNADSDQCFVIEDSINGVKAAKAAQMKCIGFENYNSYHQDLKTADLIVHSFDEKNINSIIEFIEK